VKKAFVEEQPLMLICNPYAFPAYDRVLVTAGKTPFVRFDPNDYSVPANFARRQLLVEASLDTVTISNGLQTVAKHPRSFDKGLQIENQSTSQLTSDNKYWLSHDTLTRIDNSRASKNERVKAVSADTDSLFKDLDSSDTRRDINGRIASTKQNGVEVAAVRVHFSFAS
jgi:hypothetical protein